MHAGSYSLSSMILLVSSETESNRRPAAYKAAALPAELSELVKAL